MSDVILDVSSLCPIPSSIVEEFNTTIDQLTFTVYKSTISGVVLPLTVVISLGLSGIQNS